MIQFVTESAGLESFDAFLRDLLVADWTSPGGPLRLSADLSLADLAEAEFFLNTRLFVTALAEEDGAPATATGNLNRIFVDRMFDRLKLPSLSRKSIQHCCKVLNEHDLWAKNAAAVCPRGTDQRPLRLFAGSFVQAGRANDRLS